MTLKGVKSLAHPFHTLTFYVCMWQVLLDSLIQKQGLKF